MDPDTVFLLTTLAKGPQPFDHLIGRPPHHLPADRLRATVDEAKSNGWIKGLTSHYGDPKTTSVEELQITDEGRQALAAQPRDTDQN